MSKIFDALQRGEGQIPDTILAAIRSEAADVLTPAVEMSSNGTTGLATKPGLATKARVVTKPGVATPTIGPGPVPAAEPRYRIVRLSAVSSVLVFSADQRVAGEQYRILRTKIVQHPARPRVLLVSSAGPGDGKTTTAINLATALSLKSDGDVLLIDGDFRRAAVASQLGVPEGPGVAGAVTGACALQDAIVRTEQFPSLCILTAGQTEQNPAELLDSPQWVSLCAKTREAFRYVVIDSPPISAVADYDLLQAIADGVILTASPDLTPRKLLFKALDTIPKEKLIGVVLNRVPKWFLFKSGSHDYYQYYSRTR